MQDISKIITSNKSRYLLVENELKKKLQTFDATYFRGKDHVEGNYLLFKPMSKYFKKIANTKSILSWKSKGFSDAVIKSPTINNNSLVPKLEDIDKNMFVKTLYLIFNNVGAYTEYNPTEDDSETKYLDFVSTSKKKEALENYTDLWNEVKDQFKTISGDNPIECKKDFIKATLE